MCKNLSKVLLVRKSCLLTLKNSLSFPFGGVGNQNRGRDRTGADSHAPSGCTLPTGKGGGTPGGSGGSRAWSINSHFALFCSHPARTPPKAAERGGGWDPHCLAKNSPRNRNRPEVNWEKTGLTRKRGGEGTRVGTPSFGC